MNLVPVLGVTGTIIGWVRALPQLAGLMRSGRAKGVSPDTAATSSIVSLGWAAYGLLTHQWFVCLATGSSGLIFAWIAVLSIRYGRQFNEFRVTPVWLLIMCVCYGLFGVPGLGVILPVSALAANLPQFWVACREADLTDLSLGTWALTFSDGLVWGTYALIQNDIYILMAGSFEMVTSGAIILLKVKRVSPGGVRLR